VHGQQKKDICVEIERYVTQVVELLGHAVLGQGFSGKQDGRVRTNADGTTKHRVIYLHFDFERLHRGFRPVIDHDRGQETGERERDEYAERVGQHRIPAGQ